MSTATRRVQKDIGSVLAADGAATSGWSGRRLQRLGMAVAAPLLILFVAFWRFNTGQQAVRYQVEPVTRGSLVVLVTATGSVQPTNKVDVSSELSGTVRKVLVDYNSRVIAGQPLAELDTDKLKAVVDSSRARLAATRAKVTDAEATVVEKRRDLDRKRALAGKQFASVHDLDLAQAAHDRAGASLASARADVGVAEAELQLNETNFVKACICSPIDGIVLKRNVDPGQTVASAFQAPVLFTIAEDLKQMELQVDIDEADVGKVKIGHGASFSVDAFPDRKFPASIRDLRFASETIQGVVTYKAMLVIDNSELLLRPGMTATAEIRVTEIADSLLVPNAAFRYSPAVQATDERSFLRRLLPGPPRFRTASPREEGAANRTVWVLRNGVPASVKVVIGQSDGKRTQIVGGGVNSEQLVIVDQLKTNS